jgi:hypothetical protein
MRFRPANIRLINRRNYLPRLLLALSSNSDKSKDNDKNHPINVQRLTGHSISEPIRKLVAPTSRSAVLWVSRPTAMSGGVNAARTAGLETGATFLSRFTDKF